MSSSYIDIRLAQVKRRWMRIQAIAPGTFRIRMNGTGTFSEPPLIRYGFIHVPSPEQLAPEDCLFLTSQDTTVARAGYAELQVDTRDGQLLLTNTTGKNYVQTSCPPYCHPPDTAETSYGLRFSLIEDESFYGLGNINSESIQRRGLKALIWAQNNILESAPIPFLMSSRGWAILMNTTWKHTFDIGCTISDLLSIEGFGGELDFFLFAGDNYAELLNLYTAISGKPQLLPIWMYGLNFCSRENSHAREILDDAIKFRRSGTPCDLIGLNKGWTQDPEDGSNRKNWHPERFPTSTNKLLHKVTFIGILQKQGFKLSLCIGCEYDLTAEEEHQSGGNGLEKYAAFEPWYAHLRRFVDDGISAFVVTIRPSVYSQCDKLWANGMSIDELHNLYAIMLGRQMFQGFRNQTGTRPVVHIEKGYIGMQQYMATTSGTYYNAPQAVIAILNYGLSGHVNTSTNMHLITREGIHSDFLLTWSRVNSQNHFQHPDFLEHPLDELFKTYSRLRYRLLPYLYSASHVAALTGMPITRAMPLMYPDDLNCRDLSQQYMLGDDLLVVVYTNQVYLPEGIWIDYWTGKRYNGATSFDYTIPDQAGGALFVRAGAILPMWPRMDYIGQIEVQTITLHIYPYQNSEFTLYEDDGISFCYLDGEIATTHIACTAGREQLVIQITRRSGRYTGMPAKRCYEVVIHTDSKPSVVRVNDERRPDHTRRTKTDLFRCWRYDRLAGTVQLLVEEAPSSEQGNEDALTIEVVHAVKSRSDANSHAQSAKAPALRTIAGDHITFEALLESALDTGELAAAETALTGWWTCKMNEPVFSETWPLQLMNICHLIMRHAEQRGWATNEVFAGKIDVLTLLQKLDSPEQGFQLPQHLVRQFIHYANRNQQQAKHPVVRQIIHIVENGLDQDLTLKTMAERVSLHPVHLSRLFKRKTGQVFSDYVMDKRMTQARKLMEAGLNVYETAAHTGFKDAGNFSKAFSKYWGAPPVHFKANQTKH